MMMSGYSIFSGDGRAVVRRMVILMVAAWLTCGSATGASYRFDMGGVDTPLAPGYTLVTAETTVEKNPAFGWRLTVPQKQFYPRLLTRDDPVNPIYAYDSTAEYALYSDMVWAIEEIAFDFAVEPGSYAVTAAIGDLSPGEVRPGNSIWANGVQVVNNETSDGQIKAFTFQVDAAEGKISLRFRSDDPQKYVQVAMVSAEPLASGQSCVPSVTTYPYQNPGPEVFKRNWVHYQAKYAAKWEKIRRELMAEDPSFETWRSKAEELRRSTGYHLYYAVPNSFPYFRRIDKLAQGITMEGFCAAFKEMGLDGLMYNADTVVQREFAKHGLSFCPGSGGEKGFFGMNSDAYVQNLLMDAAGKTSTVPGNWSSHDPKLLEDFRAANMKQVAPTLKGAAFLLVDEPRGEFFAGSRFGDHSAAAQAAFKLWAAGKGYAELAQKGIPPRGRTMDFYRYYRFRMEGPGLFTRAVLKGVTPAGAEVAVGQGDAGPQGLNHNSFFPPLIAQSGFSAATWAYGTPAENKMFAEAVKTAEEYGARSYIFLPLELPKWFWKLRGYQKYTPADSLTAATAGISAANCGYIVYELFFNHVDTPDWIKTLYYQARLAHAMTGLVHEPQLRVWWPESLVFNDLVELNDTEARRWKKLTQALFDANLDYAVTTHLSVPKDAVLVYACVKPVLNDEEFARLKGFIEGGGTLLAAFEGDPESPDGVKITAWQDLSKERVIRMELSPDALRGAAAKLLKKTNWEISMPAVKSYLYHRAGKKTHLLNNTDVGAPAQVKAPARLADFCSGKVYEKDAEINIPPGHYALLEER